MSTYATSKSTPPTTTTKFITSWPTSRERVVVRREWGESVAMRRG